MITFQSPGGEYHAQGKGKAQTEDDAVPKGLRKRHIGRSCCVRHVGGRCLSDNGSSRIRELAISKAESRSMYRRPWWGVLPDIKCRMQLEAKGNLSPMTKANTLRHGGGWRPCQIPRSSTPCCGLWDISDLALLQRSMTRMLNREDYRAVVGVSTWLRRPGIGQIRSDPRVNKSMSEDGGAKSFS